MLDEIVKQFRKVFLTDKRSFSLLPKAKAICPKDSGQSLTILGGKRKKN